MRAKYKTGNIDAPLAVVMLCILALLGIYSYFIVQITNQLPTYLLILACLAFVIILFRRYKSKKTRMPYAEIIIQCLFLLFIIFLHTRQTYGLWDAWAQWTPKALFLGQGTNNWKSVFSDELGYMHPGYPLLSPTIKALIGAHSPYFYQYSLLVSSLFSWLYIQISGELMHIVSNKRIPKYASLLLFLVPGFIPWIASQYADITLGCFVAAAVMSYFHYSMKHRLEYTGIFLGAALFTKDEGLMYVFYFIVTVVALEFLYFQQIKTKWRSILITLTPGIVALLLVKAQSQINDVIHHAPSELMAVTGLRIISVANFMTIYLLSPSKFLFLFPALLLAWIVFLVKKRDNSFESAFMGLFIALSLAGMGITYIATYLPLRYHIEHSIDRLVIQFLPIIMGFIAHTIFSLDNEAPHKQSVYRSRIIAEVY